MIRAIMDPAEALTVQFMFRLGDMPMWTTDRGVRSMKLTKLSSRFLEGL